MLDARHTLVAANQIQARIRALAQDIDRAYPDGEIIHMVCVLKGAFLFLADLVRQLPRPITLDFMAVASYGTSVRSSGEVRLIKDLDVSIEGRNVLIVEDIVDTGLTLTYLQEILRARAPRTLRTACLLSKPSRRLTNVPVEFVGFEIDDHFVVGFGLDFSERFRNLPDIAILPPEAAASA